MWTNLRVKNCLGDPAIQDPNNIYFEGFEHIHTENILEKNPLSFLAEGGDRNHFEIYQQTLFCVCVCLTSPFLRRKQLTKT